eukprot:CAMPEP_0114332596 /NCGR_PEP_ID=MMETSP0101-20121206/3190_1 /TAXON_ID=38822 ORGANISM="Pteridomonas danica, Strain PT" /NCGR_SAMPLE_ID=MMETSP0101 /ASSEMBLY_ACC=CAM_ASM_000211 /LENGTH=207 /DNA_ID=CAMNT_0001463327 /DNA_START=29 /DNA_END=652 /DNA_ORIENTATION=+
MPHTEPSSSGGGGMLQSTVTGLIGFGLGAIFPYKSKSSNSNNNVNKLEQTLSMKNTEISKLKSMVYEYEFQVAELKKALFQCEQDSLKRDYEEFKQPDVNGDDVISRLEFGNYIRNYMKAYPHIPADDYPTFEDFDVNRDGLVTFPEWQEYLFQTQLAEKEQEQALQTTGASKGTQNAASEMFDLSSNSDSFQALYDQLQKQQNHFK